jgi:hypothetical protein
VVFDWTICCKYTGDQNYASSCGIVIVLRLLLPIKLVLTNRLLVDYIAALSSLLTSRLDASYLPAYLGRSGRSTVVAAGPPPSMSGGL